MPKPNEVEKQDHVESWPLYGFSTEEELAKAIEAWREMERRARRLPAIVAEQCSEPKATFAQALWQAMGIVLEPVNTLDSEAGRKAIDTWLATLPTVRKTT